MRLTSRINPYIIYFITLISVMSLVALWHTPYSGDDWAYMGVITGENARISSWLDYPRALWGHWLWANGRLANYLATPLLVLLPHWLNAVICAVAQWGMYIAAVVLAGCSRKPFAGIALVAAMVILLPWWDSMTVFDCQYNYVWSTAWGLSAIFLIMRDNAWCKSSFVAALVFVFLGGMMHEGFSVAASAGLLAYIAVGGWRPDYRQRCLLTAFFLGTALATLSPGIMMRASSQHVVDASPFMILLVSDPIVIFLGITFIIMAFNTRTRKSLNELFHSPACVFAIGAFVSAIISGISGIIGRSGWFAEVFAMIVFANLAQKYISSTKVIKSIITATCLFAVIISAYAAVWQIRLGEEHLKFEQKLKEADTSGVIYLDYTPDNKVPGIIIGRVSGVPDADDFYRLLSIGGYMSTDSIYPIVLPTEAAFLSEKRSVLINGDVITSVEPSNKHPHPDAPKNIPLYILDDGDKSFAVQKFYKNGTAYYHITPRVIDPGDK